MVGESEARSATKAAKTLRRTPATTASISQAMAEMVSLRVHCLGRQWRGEGRSQKGGGAGRPRGGGGDGQLAVPWVGAAVGVEELLEEGVGAGPLEDARGQDGQGADLQGGLDPGWGWGWGLGSHRSVSVLQAQWSEAQEF